VGKPNLSSFLTKFAPS